jgi:hypothetical protein
MTEMNGKRKKEGTNQAFSKWSLTVMHLIFQYIVYCLFTCTGFMFSVINKITNYKKNREAFIKFAVLMPINNSASTRDCHPSALFFFSLSSLIMK